MAQGVALLNNTLSTLLLGPFPWRGNGKGPGTKVEHTVIYVLGQYSKGRDTRCDKSLRHVAATGCYNKSPRVTCENHCCCDRILSLQQCRRGDLSLRGVAAICRIVCLGLNNLLMGAEIQDKNSDLVFHEVALVVFNRLEMVVSVLQ